MPTNSLYRKELMDHYKNPKNFGSLDGPGVKSLREINPLCGDEMTVYLLTDGKKILDIRFEGRGCVISQAAASILTEKLKGMPLKNLLKLNEKDILVMAGLETIPSGRIPCALLFYSTLKKLLRLESQKT